MKNQRETSLPIRVAGITILGSFIALAVMAYLSGRQVDRSSELITQDAVPGTIAAHYMRMAMSRSIGWVMVAASAQTAESRDAGLKIVHDADTAFDDALKQYEATVKINPVEDKALLDVVKSKYAEYHRQRMGYEALILAGDHDGGAAFLEKNVVPAYLPAIRSAEDLLKYNHANTVTYTNDIRNSISILYWAVAVVLVLSLICTGVLIANFATRRREVRELRESEEKFSKAFQANPVGIVITEMESGRYIEVNKSFCQILGYSSQELIGHTSVELGMWMSEEERHRAFQPLLAGGSLRDFEMQLRTRKGESRTVLVNADLIEIGGKRCVLSLVQDITERKKAEEALRESDERYKSVIAVSNTGAWEYHLDSGYLWCSPEYFSMLGRRRVDYDQSGINNLKETWVDLLHPDDREPAAHHFAEYLKNGSIGTYENYFRLKHQDGSWVWIWSRGQTLRDAQGNVTNLTVGTHIDITERKRAESELRATNERYSRQEAALMELTRAYARRQASIADLKHKVTEIAARTLEVERVSVWRYESEQKGIACQDLFELSKQSHSAGNVHRAENYPTYFRALAEGNIIAAHDAYRDPRTVEFSESYLRPNRISSMMDAPIHVIGSVTGVICFEHVGTAPRQWTADEQTFAISIANVISLLLADEERQQIEGHLRQVQKMEGIGQLAGGVAHDFNNILAVIQMQSDLLKGSSGVSDKQAEFADEIGTTVQRAAALTRQLLLFSRREVFQPRDMDLNESITQTTKMLKRTLGENMEVELKLASRPMFVHADAGMMDQVLLNLTVNARDAMPKGGRLIIETASVELDEFAVSQFRSDQARTGSFVRLSVIDSGTGIPPEVLPKIFEPFFTTKEVGKGTGLGLATVFGIVQQHQGWIGVYSEVGQGTIFRIYLPQLDYNPKKKSLAAGQAPVRSGSETILLAEDDPSLRVSVRKALSQLGYRILEAPTGAKALDVWEQNCDEIRLLLTDLVMPGGMNGKELAERLLKENPKLKVIYMSGYSAEVVDKDFPLKEGVNFLIKPFQASQLAQAVRDSLDARA